MKVEFEDSYGKRRVIAEVKDSNEARRTMMKFLENRNFRSYYQRYTVINNEVQIDVGSWTEFFWFTDMSADELKEFDKK